MGGGFFTSAALFTPLQTPVVLNLFKFKMHPKPESLFRAAIQLLPKVRIVRATAHPYVACDCWGKRQRT